MSLTRTQYNEIKQILDGRRRQAQVLQRMRQEEVLAAIPDLNMLKEELDRINNAELRARFSKDRAAAKKELSKCASQRKELLETKAALLKEYGYPKNYLDPVYSCRECRDTGYVGDKKCRCFKKLESDLINAQSGLPGFRAVKDLEHLSTSVYDDTAPMQDLPRGAKKLTQRAYMEETVIPLVKKFVDGFEKPSCANLFLTGPAGTGKTFLSAAVAGSLIARQHTVIYVSTVDLFDMYRKAAVLGQAGEEVLSRIEKTEEAELLIIDDLGTENISDFSISRFFALISRRLSEGKSTIISSNMGLNEVSNAYRERITSRIKGNYLVIKFFGTDLRLKTAKR